MNLQRATLNFQALSMGTDVLGTVPSKHTSSLHQAGRGISQSRTKRSSRERSCWQLYPTWLWLLHFCPNKAERINDSMNCCAGDRSTSVAQPPSSTTVEATAGLQIKTTMYYSSVRLSFSHWENSLIWATELFLINFKSHHTNLGLAWTIRLIAYFVTRTRESTSLFS